MVFLQKRMKRIFGVKTMKEEKKLVKMGEDSYKMA